MPVVKTRIKETKPLVKFKRKRRKLVKPSQMDNRKKTVKRKKVQRS